jgi:hypothetical protein
VSGRMSAAHPAGVRARATSPPCAGDKSDDDDGDLTDDLRRRPLLILSSTSACPWKEARQRRDGRRGKGGREVHRRGPCLGRWSWTGVSMCEAVFVVAVVTCVCVKYRCLSLVSPGGREMKRAGRGRSCARQSITAVVSRDTLHCRLCASTHTARTAAPPPADSRLVWRSGMRATILAARVCRGCARRVLCTARRVDPTP